MFTTEERSQKIVKYLYIQNHVKGELNKSSDFSSVWSFSIDRSLLEIEKKMSQTPFSV